MKPFVLFFILSPLCLLAQKKPLDHSVYDGWQSIGERLISADGRWVVYTITPQEGDAGLFIKSTEGRNDSLKISRGYNAVISPDSRFVVCRIRPWYKELREARIRKKRADDFPKDSLALVSLENLRLIKMPGVRSFKTPEKASGWLAYLKEKEPSRSAIPATQRTVDSLKKKIDSLQLLVVQLKNIKAGNGDDVDAEDDPVSGAQNAEGSDLVLRHLADGKERVFKNVVDYFFAAYGQKLLMHVAKSKDARSVNAVVLFDLANLASDTILKGGNDFRNFALTEDGSKIAFLAERDTNTKALQKFYGLYLYRRGDDSAFLLVDKKTCGMQLGMTVSENGNLNFSRSGNRLFFGTAPIQPAKDTSLVDIDLVKLDIWHYKDDYLQTQQLFQLNNELKRNYLAVYDFSRDQIAQLGSKELPLVMSTNEGDGNIFVGVSDTGRRVESQWTGRTKKDVYAVDVRTGKKTLVKKNLDGQVYPSSTGKYILLYDDKARNYFVWNGSELQNVTSKIKVPLYNEENDVPDDPAPYGIMGWHEGDSAVYIYDRYDVWKVDPAGRRAPSNITELGRKNRNAYRYVKLDEEEKFIRHNQILVYRYQNQDTKKMGIEYGSNDWSRNDKLSFFTDCPCNFNYLMKAKNANRYLVSVENYQSSDLYFFYPNLLSQDHAPVSAVEAKKISSLNPQQSSYNWGTAELYHWKAFNGKPATGILYKPEDFDPNRKYPMIIYFYEKLSDSLNKYLAPAPTPSRLNIPFFVSRGYLVFTPDISYTKGHPGKDAYNYVVSGAQALARNKWVDEKNIGVQGQSWGGYQVAYLITATHLFKAAWAGAPVVNMFSAYGGIRWESGNNRQSQYEKGQSRIGATPWDRPELYIENSPLFHLQNVTTPLVIMSNDADGAVPWYQGIEFFTAMRRLNKKVWLLNYNGEAHNLVERKNRKDIQVREQQYFDWMLKGATPPEWLTEGVPAVKKGRDWGLD